MSRIVVPTAVTLVGLGVAFAILRPAARPLPAPASVPTERLRLRIVTLTNALAQPWVRSRSCPTETCSSPNAAAGCG